MLNYYNTNVEEVRLSVWSTAYGNTLPTILRLGCEGANENRSNKLFKGVDDLGQCLYDILHQHMTIPFELKRGDAISGSALIPKTYANSVTGVQNDFIHLMREMNVSFICISNEYLGRYEDKQCIVVRLEMVYEDFLTENSMDWIGALLKCK